MERIVIVDIQNIKRAFQIPAIKKSLKENRDTIELLSTELLELEKNKENLLKNLKSRESLMKRAIAQETEIGKTKKKFTNDALRDAEFISRSAGNEEISALREEIYILSESINHKKILIEIETSYRTELLLDYKLAIALITTLSQENINIEME